MGIKEVGFVPIPNWMTPENSWDEPFRGVFSSPKIRLRLNVVSKIAGYIKLQDTDNQRLYRNMNNLPLLSSTIINNTTTFINTRVQFWNSSSLFYRLNLRRDMCVSPPTSTSTYSFSPPPLTPPSSSSSWMVSSLTIPPSSASPIITLLSNNLLLL